MAHMFRIQQYALLSLLIHIAYVQDQCGIHETNNLIHAICPLNDTQHVQDTNAVTFSKNVSLVYHEFYHYLTTDWDEDIAPYNDTQTTIQNITVSPEQDIEPKTKANSFNFAAFDSGATILSATQGIKSAKSILLNRKEKYMMMPCNLQEKWFIIQLSEDIVMNRLELISLEHYSSKFKDLRIYARNHNYQNDNDINAKNNWIIISDITLQNKNKNSIEFDDNHWVRSIKIEILSFYGNEYYCTMTQIKVFGSTMLPHWKNELLSSLDEVDKIKSNITNDATQNTPIADNNAHIPQITMNADHQIHDTQPSISDKRESVFTILTKRITSLELNLTKQQMQVTRLVEMFNGIKDLDERFNEYQMNLTNHMLYQSYGISMMLKSIKEQNNVDINEDHIDNDSNDGQKKKEKDSFRMYGDWSSQTSYFNDVLSWKRHETLERIENYIETLLFLMSNLYWIGLIIIIFQVIMIVCFVFYLCGYCVRRKNHSRKGSKHKTTAALTTTNAASRKKFVFTKPLNSARSQSSSGVLKRRHRKHDRKKLKK